MEETIKKPYIVKYKNIDLELYKKWASSMHEDQIAEMLWEHHQMKNGIFERTFGIATGSDDWLHRASLRSTHLRDCEQELRALIHSVHQVAQDAANHTRLEYCRNCMGKKIIGEQECVICKGTGKSYYD